MEDATVHLYQADTPELVATARDLFREYARAIGTDLEYQGFNVKESQYTELASPEYGTHLDIFQVPVIGSFTLNGDKGKKINPWFYDASSTNRHNRNSFEYGV